MKSKKAEEYIIDNEVHFSDACNEGSIYFISNKKAIKSVEIAEEEMREKAIEAHFNSCSHLYDRNCDIFENGMCEYRSGGKCKYMSEFIEEVNK